MPLTRDDLAAYNADIRGGAHFANRIVPLPDHGAVYVKNAKVGTSTLLTWLQRIRSGDPTWTPQVNVHKEHDLPTPWGIGWPATLRLLSGDGYRFTFVREPLARLESAYRDKILGHPKMDDWRNEICALLGLEQDGRRVDFEQFVTALEMQPVEQMDAHWRPQHLILMHPLISYDKVGRLERFAADLAEIRSATGLPEIAMERRNAMERPDGSVYDGRPDLRDRVQRLYATDFELYGY